MLECVVSDKEVLRALGAAETLRNIKGTVPSDLLSLLNQGPGNHIRKHAYRYRKLIDRELIYIRRAKDMQWRGITFIGTGIAAAMIGVANFVAQLGALRVYDEM